MRVIFSSTVFGVTFFSHASKSSPILSRILVGHQAHAHLGHRHGRQHRLRALSREPGQQAVHLEGRPRPDALERRVAAFAEQLRRAQFLAVLLLVERQLRQLVPFCVAQRPHIVIEARDPDAPTLVLHLRQHLRQHHRGVGHRAAKRTRVQVGLRAAKVDLEVRQAAQAVADGRDAAVEHRRIAR